MSQRIPLYPPGSDARRRYSREWARAHYVPVIRPTPQERFWAKVDRSGGPFGCWLWTGGRTKEGYGISRPYGSHGRTSVAHRVAYQWTVGPIPEGLELDHLCRNPPCVNPAHLEPVTPRENVRRGNSPAAIHGRKTHCAKGHPFDAENTHVSKRQRTCRECHRVACRDYMRRKRAAAA